MNPIFFRLLVLIVVFNFSTANCQNPIQSTSEKVEEMSFQSNEIITFLRKPLNDSLRLVSQHSKYGIIDSTGEIVVPLIYDHISVNFAMREIMLLERIYLSENEFFYFFYENGGDSEEEYNKMLLQEMAKFNSPYNLERAFRTQPFFAAKKEHLWGVINGKNETLIPFEYDLIEEIGQNIFLAKKNHSFEILTPENKRIVESCDTIAVPISNYTPIPLGSEFAFYAIMVRNNKYGAINLYNLETIQPKYDSLEFCYFLYEDLWLCAFDKNEIRLNVILEQFNRNHEYNNVIRYKLGNKVGLLDVRCMEELTPASFDTIRLSGMYRENGQLVQLNDRYTFLTHDNTRLHDKLYDSVGALGGSGYYKVYQNGKAGIYNDFGEKVLPIKWEDIQYVFHCHCPSSPYFIIKLNGKFGVVNSRGKKIIAAHYDSIVYKYENSIYFLELQREGKLEKIYVEDL